MPSVSFKQILALILFCFLVAVLLVFLGQPAIISSVFLASGVATLVYHLLGGITHAEFNMGPVKLGGSIAALIGSAWFINIQLEKQQFQPDNSLSLNSNHEVLSGKGQVLGKLNLGSYYTLDKGPTVVLDDSIKLGQLSLESLRLIDGLKVKSGDDIELGALSNDEVQSLGFFNKSDLSLYTEIKYDLKLSPFDRRTNTDFWQPPHRDLQNRYNGLPFEITPEFINGSDRTVVKYKGSETTHELEIGSQFFIEDEDDKSMVYFVRIRNLTRNRSRTSWNNYVIYQIVGIRNGLQ